MSSDVAWRDSGDDGAGEARAQQAQNFVNHGEKQDRLNTMKRFCICSL